MANNLNAFGFTDSSVQPGLPEGTGLSLGTTLDPERFRMHVYTHNSRQRLRWWKAFPNPLTMPDPVTKDYEPDAKTGQASGMIYVEQQAMQYPALVEPIGKNTERHFQSGTLPTGGITVITLPDELPLAKGDIIAPWGKNDSPSNSAHGPSIVPNTTFVPGRAVVKRGDSRHHTRLAGNVFVDIDARTLDGVGTRFTRDLMAGDVLTALGETAVIAKVESDTLARLQSSTMPETPWNNAPLVRIDDRLPEPTAFLIESILLTDAWGNWTIAPQDAYRLSPTGDRILWNALPGITQDDGKAPFRVPAPGESYSVSYRYFPRYIVEDDLSRQAPPVNGKPLPQVVVCSLRSGVVR